MPFQWWGRSQPPKEHELDKYRPYLPILEEISLGVEGAVAGSDMDDVIAAVVDKLTAEEVVTLLRARFAALPVEQQWQELTARIPDKEVLAAIERERERVRLHADPERAIQHARLTAQRTGLLNLEHVPVNCVVEIDFVNHKSSYSGTIRTIKLLRCPSGFRVVMDDIFVSYQAQHELCIGEIISLGIEGEPCHIVRDAELAFRRGQQTYDFRVYYTSESKWLRPVVRACRVNQQNMFG